MNIFCTGNSNKDLFYGLDFEKYKQEQGYSSDNPVNKDEGVTHTKAENKQQAEATLIYYIENPAEYRNKCLSIQDAMATCY